MDPARYEAHLWEQMIQMVGFLLVTYLPLQIGSILIVKHPLARLAAALPLIPMLPVIYAGMNQNAYRDGSLYGLVIYFVYAPLMVYLAIVFLAGLAGRLRKGNTSDSEATTGSKELPLPLVLLTVVVVLGAGVFICSVNLLPR